VKVKTTPEPGPILPDIVAVAAHDLAARFP
jgi:hypothetical protein